jgi:hypothetical protein
MNNNEINGLISDYLKKNGASSSDDKNRAKVESLLKGLSDKQAGQLKSILGDSQKTREILNSPAAKALIKKLSK